MGRSVSKLQADPSIYETLQINETATPEEIRRQYFKLLIKYNPDTGKEKNLLRTQQIVAAYKKLKDRDFKPILIEKFVIPKFDIYTSDYLKSLGSNYYKKVEEIYNVIETNEKRYVENIKLPNFGDDGVKMSGTSAFYVFFKGFKTQVRFETEYNGKLVYDRDYNKESRNLYNDKVKELTKIVYATDPRLKRNIHENVVKKIPGLRIKKEKVKKEKDINKYKFYCDACSKGFMSLNTLINHMKGDKHKKILEDLGLEEKTIEEIKVENQQVNNVKEAELTFLEKEEIIIVEDYKNDDKIVIEHVIAKIKNINLKSKKQATHKKKTTATYKEAAQSLTCAKCKESFESRNKLFDHIRQNHGQG